RSPLSLPDALPTHPPDRARQAAQGRLQVVVEDLHRVAGRGQGADGGRRGEQGGGGGPGGGGHHRGGRGEQRGQFGLGDGQQHQGGGPGRLGRLGDGQAGRLDPLAAALGAGAD